MSGQNGDSAFVRNSFVSTRLQFRHNSSQDVMRIISPANWVGQGTIWTSDVCSLVVLAHMGSHAFSFASNFLPKQDRVPTVVFLVVPIFFKLHRLI